MEDVTFFVQLCAMLGILVMLMVAGVATYEYRNGAQHLMVGPALSCSVCVAVLLSVNAYMISHGLSSFFVGLKLVVMIGFALSIVWSFMAQRDGYARNEFAAFLMRCSGVIGMVGIGLYTVATW